MERKSYVRPDFVNNFYIMQQGYDAGIIVLCSYHNINNVIEICGWLPKSESETKGIFYSADASESEPTVVRLHSGLL